MLRPGEHEQSRIEVNHVNNTSTINDHSLTVEMPSQIIPKTSARTHQNFFKSTTSNSGNKNTKYHYDETPPLVVNTNITSDNMLPDVNRKVTHYTQ